jgi:FkbM family methyltransferase
VNLRGKVKAFYKGIIFSLSAANNPLYISYLRYIFKPSPGTIDAFASFYSKKKVKVFTVQIGANDGINNDPIHKFIKRDSWTGILLEPQAYVFDTYLKPLYRKTTGITVVRAALDYEDGERTLYNISVSRSRWATGLSSFSREVLEAAVESGYIEREAGKEGALLPAKKEEYISEEKVECISAETLVNRYGIEHIDWLQIDTEGYDFEIIKMFAAFKIKPEVIVYENLHFPESLSAECEFFLREKGYYCQSFGPNTVAVRLSGAEFVNFLENDRRDI